MAHTEDGNTLILFNVGQRHLFRGSIVSMDEIRGLYEAEEARFAESVKERREASGMNQSELARRMVDAGWANYNQMTVARTEKGERPIRLSEARALAQVLGSSVTLMSAPPKDAGTVEELAYAAARLRTNARRVYSAVSALYDSQEQVHDLLTPMRMRLEEVTDPEMRALGDKLMGDLENLMKVGADAIEEEYWRSRGWVPADELPGGPA